MTAFDWTDERVERMLSRWHQGYSAGAIAEKEFGFACSRNAVIGKLSRMGLKRALTARGVAAAPIVRLYRQHNPKLSEPKRKRKRRSKPQKTAAKWSDGVRMPKFQPEPITIIEDQDIPIRQRRTLLQFNSGT